MKKTLKIFLFLFCLVFIAIIALFTLYWVMTANVKLDKQKLVNMERIVTYYDKNGNKFSEESNGISITEIKNIPNHVKRAFIAIEDKRFYEHSGIDYRALFRATVNNLSSFSFKEGASTISQQLIKNTHLSNEKTLKRKLLEIKLAKELEKNYSKDEILEKYLNTIYFGNGCYGITQASKYYFNKTPEFLDINEGAILAGIIKAPTHYSPIANNEKCLKRKNLVLLEMKNQGYITDSEYQINIAKGVSINEENINSNYNFLTLARNEYNSLIKNCPYKCNNFSVYTTLDPQIQEILDQEKLVNQGCENSNVILDKKSNVVAFQSTCLPSPRQPGSTIKPLLVYAPAIENDLVFSCSPILDEKTDFNGYSPSNYNDNYYGYVSVKESLAKSLNTCAVKILNYVGVDKAKSYLEKTDIKLDEKDNSLCLALGATTNGITLKDLTSSYSVFLNEGNFYSASCINKITTENKEIIYKKNEREKSIFSNETVSILNDMMEYTVTNGTAKKLSYCNIPLYAKTGTVGNKDGNTDAYTISYTSEYILGSWCGGINYGLMNNKVTGGNTPANQSRNIWVKIYNNYYPSKITVSENLQEEYIDMISYENNHTVKLADPNAPLRYKELALFKKNKLPLNKSTDFSEPKIETPKLTINNNEIKISLCQTQLYNLIIYKHYNNKKFAIYDTANNNKEFYIDKDVLPNVKYVYSVVPYYKSENKIFYGQEIKLEPIKISSAEKDDWWKNELE